MTYEGWVRHRRHGDVDHEFRYRISMDYREVAGHSVRDLVEEQTGLRPEGPVRLLEARRSLGVGFNPVRFSYCWHADALHSVVAEVTNTPWGERHSYVLDPAGGRLDKQLHVSPFQPMDQVYSWRLTEPGDQLIVHMENHQDGQRVFDATLSLRRTQRSPRRLQPLKILVAIYSQALRLKVKGARYHAPPKAAA
jgi:DUF1365 family protein